ncbi:MAG TPA: TOMM precursor leader peptide-binding protein [Solirubrobacterales bacterium]|nr:TOMM precursor leader peptide-binding protein [Solirubrobacterales bacterium]
MKGMLPRIKRTIEPVDGPDGEIVMVRGNGFPDVRITGLSERDRALVAALDGSRSVAQLERRFGVETVMRTLEGMREMALLEDAADDRLVPPADLDRYDRQLLYFSDLASGAGVTPSQCQARLASAKVAVLGLGGLGGRVALELACCGVGELWIVDGDRVETSNLNRQIQFEEADVGTQKAKAMAARLRAFNSAIRVRAEARRLENRAQVAEFVAGADVVVNAADWPAHEIEAWCNAACFEAGIPHICMAQAPPLVRVGPLYVPGQTGCHECQQDAWRRDYPLFEAIVERQRSKPSVAATLGPASGLIAAQVGMDVVHLLTGLERPASWNASCMYDLRSMEVQRYELPAEPRCPICLGGEEQRNPKSHRMEV